MILSLHIAQASILDKQREEKMNSEQVRDFVRKLGFVDKDKKGGNQIKQFLHLYQVSATRM